MNLEDLNKPQLILLTLLVSFITSIATGIMTVALLTQTQSPIVRTINNVVEHTIEKVVPGPSEPVKDSTPAVSEDSKVTSAIASASKSLVRLYTVADASTASSTDLTAHGVFRGIGAIASSDGMLVVPDAIVIPGRTYVAVTANGDQMPATIVTEGRGDLALMKLALGTTTPAITPATIGTPDSLTLGQTVIALSGSTRTNAAVGIVSDLAPGTDAGSVASISGVAPAGATPGSLLITDTGALVGVYVSDSGAYSPVSTPIITSLATPLTEKPSATSSTTTNTAAAAHSITQ